MSAKPWYKSLTFQALCVSVAAHVLTLLGIADDVANETALKLVEGVLPVAGIVADAVAAWGRTRAQGPVTMTQSGAASKSVQGGFASAWMLVWIATIAAATIFVLALGGCASKPAAEAPDVKQVLVETSVRIAVRHAIADSPRATEKAQNIRDVVVQLQSFATSVTTVADLKAHVTGELDNLMLSPLDRADADDLLNLLSAVLESQVASQSIDGDLFVPVEQFLQLVLNSIPTAA